MQAEGKSSEKADSEDARQARQKQFRLNAEKEKLKWRSGAHATHGRGRCERNGST